MNFKSRSVFKNFSAVFLLLLVVVAVFIPIGEAKALDLFSFDIFSSLVDWNAKLLKGDSTFMTTIYWLAYRIISLGLYLTTVLVYFGAWLVDVFLDENIYRSVLNMKDPTSAVYIGWTTVRDACNTFFILFLLLIAFSTILRIQTYNAKSLLPKLIISLFLINFSATIAMMVIDFGQVFMFEIKEWMGAGGFSGASGAGTPLTSIVDYFHNEYGWHKPPPSGEYLMSDVVSVMFAVVYSVILGLLYIMLALFLMVRIIVFVILVIISPFAFFSIILPGMRTYTSQWWQSLVSHAIFGPVFLFFIFLSGKMAQSMQTFDSPVPEPEDISALSYIIAKLIPHIVALGMLMAAIPVTQKLGVAGANKFIGGAAGLGKVGIGVVAAAKLAGGAGKKVGGGIDNRIMKGKVSDWGRKQKENVLTSKVLLGLGRGSALKNKAETERKREEKMKTVRLEFGEAKNRDIDLLQKKANGKLATKEDKALFTETAAAQGKLGDKKYAGDVEKFMPEMERTLSGKELEEVTDKSLSLAMTTNKNKGKVEKLENTKNEATGEKYTHEEADLEVRKELVNDLVEKGKTHELQDTKNGATAKAYREVVKGEQRKSDMNRMSPEQRAAMAEGNLEIIDGNSDIIKGIKEGGGTDEEKKKRIKEVEEDNMDISSDIVKLGKGLEESFAWGGDEAAEKIKKAFPDFNHKDVAKMSPDDLDGYGHNGTYEQLAGLDKAGEYKTARKIEASMANRIKTTTDPKEKKDLEEILKRRKNKPTKSSGGGGSSPIAHSEPKSRQSISGDKSASGQGGSNEASYQRTKGELGELAKSGGFDQGIEISGKLGMSAPREKNGKLLMGSKTVDNLREAFEADKEFAERGAKDMIRHEEQHGKGPALGSSQKMASELKKYSEQEEVSSEDIKNKEAELKEKYYTGGEKGAGYEMQTELQRVNEGYKNKDKFIEDEARMHVMTDVAYEGMDKMGEIEYGPENSGLHRTHSAFIKKDVVDKITKEMEVMRQDLVAKHNAKKGTGNEEPSDSGDDDTNVEGGDEFMTGGGEGGAGEEPKKSEIKNGKKTGSEKIREAYLKTNIAIGEADKIALKAVGTVRKDVGIANRVVIPAINEGIKVNKRKLADPTLTNKEIKKEEIEKFKGILRPAVSKSAKKVVSKNADKGVEVVGNKAVEVLNKAAENTTGKKKIVLKAASAVAGSKQMQGVASRVIKNKAGNKDGGEEKQTDIGENKTSVSGDSIKENVETKPQTKVEKIKKVAGAVNEVASRMDMKRVAGRRGKDPVEETKMAMKVVDVGSKLDERIAMIKPVADVLLEEQLKIDEERQGGKEISQWQEDKRKFVALKKSVGKIIPKDSKNDGKYIGRAGAALSEVGKNVGGTKGAVLEKAGKVLQNEKAQKVISKEARSRIAKEDEKPKAQKPDTETAKQPKLKQKDSKTEKTETKPEIEERIIETKESISKGGLKSSVVKSEITFDPVKAGEEGARQIVKEAMKGMSKDMKQEITNNIAVNPSQEAVNIDLEKLINPKEIAELVTKEVDVDGVKKTLKDVQKSFDKFKGNNSGNANIPILGAAASAAQIALEKSLVVNDRNLTARNRTEQNIKLATIKSVLGKIESEMNKTNKPSVKEDE